MSKNSFKVKKGITLNPVDPSEIINPEAGDLIADSTDDNKIKRYDATSADWSSVGGSAGIGGNLMPEFEKLTPDLVNVTSAVDTVTFLPIDDNNKSIKATWSGSVGSIQFQVPVDSSLHEIQGTVSVWIRTSLDNIQVSSVQDDVKLSTLPVSGTGKWKQYELPVVVGGAEMGFIVESTTGVTGDVYIDQPFVGLTPSSYGFEVAQAEVVAQFDFPKTANCQWVRTGTSIGSFSVDTDCPPPTLTYSSGLGNPQLIDFGLPKVQINNLPVGVYKVTHIGTFFTSANNAPELALTDGITTCGTTGTMSNNNAITSSTTQCVFEVNSQGNKTFELLGAIPAGSLFHRNIFEGSRFIIEYYPPKTTIVTQLQEETVQTANVFSAKISSTDVVSDENLDWIEGNCTNATTGRATCNFKTGIFTVAPNCVCTNGALGVSGSENDCFINSLSNTSITVTTTNNNIPNNSGFNLICQKQGADYNKSRLIVGQFEQIKSGDTPIVRAQGNANQAITGTTDLPFVELVDNFNAWDGDSFTVPSGQGGYYFFSGSVYLSANAVAGIYIAINNVREQIYGFHNSSTTIHPFSGVVKVNEGDVLSLRASGGTGLSNNTDFHHLHIQKIPDIESLVKNLNPSNVKCQTKYLSANIVGVSTDIANLRFQNITVGKKYKVIGQSYLQDQTLKAIHNSSELCTTYSQTTQSTISMNSGVFTAETSTVTFNSTAGGTLFGNGTKNFTWVQLCELPDNYIETDEW